MSRPSKHGFTLVEMLVVIGIIAILAALLIPAINMAIRAARNAAIGVEINQLATAIESYKQDKGDYPPNFRNIDVLLRHIRKCYPKADPNYVTNFATLACNMANVGTKNYYIDEGEALVFWLSMTDADPRYPFLSYYNPGNTLQPAPKKYYDFDETRLAAFNLAVEEDTTAATRTADVRSHIAKFCQDTHYIYVDSRAYVACLGIGNPPTVPPAFAEDITIFVRPYWSDTVVNSSATLDQDKFKPVNATTFQIICAGQDGEFGALAASVKGFPSGFNYEDGDKDNIANFSAGRMLSDNIP